LMILPLSPTRVSATRKSRFVKLCQKGNDGILHEKDAFLRQKEGENV
jgi:hypothetical protein